MLALSSEKWFHGSGISKIAKNDDRKLFLWQLVTDHRRIISLRNPSPLSRRVNWWLATERTEWSNQFAAVITRDSSTCRRNTYMAKIACLNAELLEVYMTACVSVQYAMIRPSCSRWLRAQRRERPLRSELLLPKRLNMAFSFSRGACLRCLQRTFGIN